MNTYVFLDTLYENFSKIVSRSTIMGIGYENLPLDNILYILLQLFSKVVITTYILWQVNKPLPHNMSKYPWTYEYLTYAVYVDFADVIKDHKMKEVA